MLGVKAAKPRACAAPARRASPAAPRRVPSVRLPRPGCRALPPARTSSHGFTAADRWLCGRQEAGGSMAAADNDAVPGAPEAACSQELIDIAHQLADAAADITRQYFRAPLDVEAKGDESPVTIADRKAEAAMRALLRQALPEHGVFGEEEGLQAGDASGRFLWVLDPIDGTRSFITGKPLFGTLIALLDRGQPVLGVIDQPILRERWLGAAGRPTTLNGAEIRARACGDVREAYLYATTPHMFQGPSEAAFNRLRDRVLQPLYGCDCYAYGLLAAGHCDLVAEADLKAYDYMALVPIIEGAGGTVTDWQGRRLHWPLTPGGSYALGDTAGEVLAAGDARTHAQALAALGWQGGA